MSDFHLYRLNGKNGWLIGSEFDKKTPNYSSLLQLGRTDFIDPWKDPNFHHHSVSIELYLVLHGELWIIINNTPIKLKEKSLFLVQPGVSHSVIGGKGRIQHLGMKIPPLEDKKIIDKVDNDTKIALINSFLQNSENDKFSLPHLNKSDGFIADLKDRDKNKKVI